MISYVQVLPIGNAVRVLVTPPRGASAVRLLRRTSDAFTGPDDPGALLVGEGDFHSIVDSTALVNGYTYWYRAYAKVGGVWVDGGVSRSITPQAGYDDQSVDVLTIVRERLAAGLLIEVQRGNLVHDQGKIPVLIASPTFEDTKWPVVTLHVAADAAADRWLGEMAVPDRYDADANTWESSEGWFSRHSIAIGGWSLNPDGRMALRRAIKRIIIGNLPVFEEHGMIQVELTQQDMDDFKSYSAPVYQVVSNFSCLARSAVSSVSGAIRDVVVQPPVVP